MSKFKKRLYEIVFESDTRAGRIFDGTLLVIIVFSVLVVMLESVAHFRNNYHEEFKIIEWVVTGIFTVEYFTRIWLTRRPIRYIFSFYGLIDLLAVLPTYLGFFISGGENLLVVRVLRLIRIFRLLKLTEYTGAGRFILNAIWNSRAKLGIFITFVFALTIVIGTIMYLIEGEENGFTDIPTSIYWSIVTLTTVGYGDISPVTGLGKFFAGIVMLLGYAIIAVPTGIVTASLITKQTKNTQVCQNCMFDQHDDDALYCKKCGTPLH